MPGATDERLGAIGAAGGTAGGSETGHLWGKMILMGSRSVRQRPTQEPRRPKSFCSWSKQSEISYVFLFTAPPARCSGDGI